MRGERQLEEVERDRLGAAVFEQRRLAHMLRQRGAEIEALETSRERLTEREHKALEREEALRRELADLEKRLGSLGAEIEERTEERDRGAAELKQAQYEARRAERRAERVREGAASELAEVRKGGAAELERAREKAAAELGQMEREADAKLARAKEEAAERSRLAERGLAKAREELSALTTIRDKAMAELRQAQYETRRAGRRLAKVERTAAEDRRRARLQFDSLQAELRQGLASRDEAFERGRQALVELDGARGELGEAREEIEEARTVAAELGHAVKASALELGRTQREVELLVGLEREREVLLADCERALGEVSGHLIRVRASRSWRWGHAVSRALRTLTFRRRAKLSALDSALLRLGGGEERVPAQDEHRN